MEKCSNQCLPWAYLPGLFVFVLSATGNFARAEEALHERDVLPILTRSCLGCHGGLRKKGGLDLRTIAAMHQGGESGAAVKPGNPAASLLWQRIEANEMPEGEKKLSPEEKETIKQWLASGLPTMAEREAASSPILPAGEKHEPRAVAAAIDQHIEAKLAALRLTAAPMIDDVTFLRRVYLDLTGRVPTAEKAAAFLNDRSPDKRAKLIDLLLATPEFGEQFGRTWRDWICPPELPSDPNGGKQPHNEAREFGAWLGKRFAAGDTWDKMVRDILVVEGERRNQPHVIFHGLVGEGGKPSAAGTAKAVSSLFMGVQLQCAECHDDPYRTWAQQDHWALAAFFNRLGGDFNKVTDSGPADKKKGGQAHIIIPASAFLNAGQQVPAAYLGQGPFQGDTSASLRPALAAWLTARENPFFAKAFANRLWFYFFARGIVNPVDDMRDLNPPSHPGLLNLLSNEFAASGFDVKHLVRCLCHSQAYQRESRRSAGHSDEQSQALAAAFGRQPIRLMSADMLYDSLKLAYGEPKLDLRAIDPKGGNTNGESAPVADEYIEFLRRFGTNEDDATDFTHGIPQLLTLINHPRLLAGSKALENFRKANAAATAEQTVEWLYLSTLSRPPTAGELADSLAYLSQSPDANQAQVGLLWTLVNRSEFLFIR